MQNKIFNIYMYIKLRDRKNQTMTDQDHVDDQQVWLVGFYS